MTAKSFQQAVYDFIAANPGITGPEIAKVFNVTVNFLSHPLAKGIKLGVITRRRIPSQRYPNIGQWAYEHRPNPKH